MHLNIFDECNDEGVVQLGLLSAYPYLQFDLCGIFDLLPLNMILEIYIFSVLEQSILFFSSNLEMLNMVMFIIYILNYPCNDSPYFWHIVSVSEKNFVEENKYVGKIMVSMLGVNTTYREDIDTSVFEKYHFVVDIDNKKFFLKKAIEDLDDEEEDYNKLQTFYLDYHDTKLRLRKNREDIKKLSINDKNNKEIEVDREGAGRILVDTYEPIKNLLFIFRDNYDYVTRLISLIDENDDPDKVDSLVELFCNQFYDNILIPNPEQEELLILIYKLFDEEIRSMNSALIDDFLNESSFMGKFCTS